MQAIVLERYGSPEVLELREIDKPIPGDDQVLVQVHAASINFPDWANLRGKPFVYRLMVGAPFRPKFEIPGADLAGSVEAVGRNVTQFQPGDEVFGDISACGFGAFAEYVSVPEAALAHKPANMSFEQAAAVPMSGVVALQGLRDVGRVQAGQRVLIVGASSGNGTFLVQIAKAFGAEVTGVCGTRNLEMVRSIGADHVIDYTRDDFGQSGDKWDLIVANSGYRPLRDYQRALTAEGTYVVTGGAMKQVFEPMYQGPFVRKAPGQRMVNLAAHSDQGDLIAVKDLIETRKVVAVVDKSYPLSEAAQALAYYGQGHASGKVVIMIRASDTQS